MPNTLIEAKSKVARTVRSLAGGSNLEGDDENQDEIPLQRLEKPQRAHISRSRQRGFPRYLFSNCANSISNFHCARARSLSARKLLQGAEGLSGAPALSAAQAATSLKSSGSFHRLAPARKLCSRLWRAMRFNSE